MLSEDRLTDRIHTASYTRDGPGTREAVQLPIRDADRDGLRPRHEPAVCSRDFVELLRSGHGATFAGLGPPPRQLISKVWTTVGFPQPGFAEM
jgi:hypothetical protein